MATISEIDPGTAGLAQYGVSNGGSVSDSSPAQLDAGALAVVYGSSIALSRFGGFYGTDLSTNGGRFLWSGLPYVVTGAGGTNAGAFSVSDTTSELKLQFSKQPSGLSDRASLQRSSTPNGPAATLRCRMAR